jgi:hypothetical protein
MDYRDLQNSKYILILLAKSPDTQHCGTWNKKEGPFPAATRLLQFLAVTSAR